MRTSKILVNQGYYVGKWENIIFMFSWLWAQWFHIYNCPLIAVLELVLTGFAHQCLMKIYIKLWHIHIYSQIITEVSGPNQLSVRKVWLTFSWLISVYIFRFITSLFGSLIVIIYNRSRGQSPWHLQRQLPPPFPFPDALESQKFNCILY